MLLTTSTEQGVRLAFPGKVSDDKSAVEASLIDASLKGCIANDNLGASFFNPHRYNRMSKRSREKKAQQ
ncbi:hypothetical protein [Sodalis ligni]|uniref:Uncharacterized protein n=1 Tax=Sodalis ligni TaxID=2697027 RepID=A0A4R1NDK2_9GAMM|nr:hypothetical protein [Sodalis ligni]TCL02200.1 hypothetical protein EZJ58_0198 [Sodalis ligni]